MMKRIRYAISILFLTGAASAQDTAGVGSMAGTVATSAGRPVPDVRVCVSSIIRCSTTGGDGTFRLTGIRAGDHRLEITAPGQPLILSQSISVRAGLERAVDVTLPTLTAAQSVTVSESEFVAPEEVKTSGFLVQRDEIFRSAGSLQDVSRYVQTLPGVAIGTDDMRNDIIVRGGSPLENLFIVDNVEIPNINSFANFASAGGTASILDADLIRDVTFLTGGYPAPFINRASSVLQIAQREGSREAFSKRLSLGYAGVGGILEGPIGNGERGSWVFSGKRSFLDAFTDDIGFGGVPVTYIFNTKTLYDLTHRDRIWVVNISGTDRIRLGPTDEPRDDDPDRNPEFDLLDVNYRGWRSATGFNWQRLLGSRGVGLLGVSHAEANVGATVKDLFKRGVPAPSLSDLIANTPSIYREDSREGETTVKYDLTAYAPFFDKVQAGGSFKIFRIRYNTEQPLGNDNPYSPVQDLNPFSLTRNLSAYQRGAYFQSTRNLTTRLNLTWGGRFDDYTIIAKNRLSPRAGLSYQINHKLSWRGSYGVYYQQPLFLFIEAFPQNKGLNPIRSAHYVTGFSYSFSPTVRATLEAYRKDYSNYPAATQFPSFSLANSGDTFKVSDILLPYASAGRGRVRGIEVLIEKRQSGRWHGQANVAISRTRHAASDGVFKPGTYDYPVIFNSLGGYRMTKKWDLSGRFVYLSGKPYTPFDETISKAQKRGVYDLTQVNGYRAPDYLRLDLRLDRTFTVRNKPLLFFVGVQNVTNRRNIAQAAWDRERNELRFNRQLGRFPLIGLDWKF